MRHHMKCPPSTIFNNNKKFVLGKQKTLKSITGKLSMEINTNHKQLIFATFSTFKDVQKKILHQKAGI